MLNHTWEVNIWLVVWNMNVIVPYLGNVITPTDFHSIIFQRGRSVYHQPDAMGFYHHKIPWNQESFLPGILGSWDSFSSPSEMSDEGDCWTCLVKLGETRVERCRGDGMPWRWVKKPMGIWPSKMLNSLSQMDTNGDFTIKNDGLIVKHMWFKHRQFSHQIWAETTANGNIMLDYNDLIPTSLEWWEWV